MHYNVYCGFKNMLNEKVEALNKNAWRKGWALNMFVSVECIWILEDKNCSEKRVYMNESWKHNHFNFHFLFQIRTKRHQQVRSTSGLRSPTWPANEPCSCVSLRATPTSSWTVSRTSETGAWEWPSRYDCSCMERLVMNKCMPKASLQTQHLSQLH